MEQGEQYINALMGNDDPYYDEYTYNEEYEESDTVEDDTDSALTDVLRQHLLQMLYHL